MAVFGAVFGVKWYKWSVLDVRRDFLSVLKSFVPKHDDRPMVVYFCIFSYELDSDGEARNIAMEDGAVIGVDAKEILLGCNFSLSGTDLSDNALIGDI